MITDEYKAEMKKRHDEHIKWGASSIKFGGHEIVQLIEKYKGTIRTVLDYGCGKGVLADWVNPRLHVEPPEWTMYDPGIPGIDRLPEKKFDMVMTCDVMEHVEIQCVDDTIRELQDRTKIVLYNNIACSPCSGTFSTGPYVGENIHITIREADWWFNRFEAALDPCMQMYELKSWVKRARGRYRERCVLVHERI